VGPISPPAGAPSGVSVENLKITEVPRDDFARLPTSGLPDCANVIDAGPADQRRLSLLQDDPLPSE
jgi:hypothetical protein